MPTVSNTERDPGGNAHRNVPVRVRLVAALVGVAPGYVPTEDYSIIGSWATRTDNDGDWSVDLVSNELIAPADTFYQADVSPKVGPAIRHQFAVPDGAGPYRVEDILTDPPANLPTTLSDLLEAEVAARTAADAAEAAARAAEDIALGSAIASEVTARTAAVAAEAAARVADVNAEEVRALAAESAEAAARAAADTALGSNIAAETAARIAGDDALADALADSDANLAAETAARVADVNAEETRALVAESALAGDITAEESRALAAESVMAADIDGLIVDVGTIDTNLASEVADRIADVTAEETRALAAEALKANDNAVVKLVGNQTVAGVKDHTTDNGLKYKGQVVARVNEGPLSLYDPRLAPNPGAVTDWGAVMAAAKAMLPPSTQTFDPRGGGKLFAPPGLYPMTTGFEWEHLDANVLVEGVSGGTYFVAMTNGMELFSASTVDTFPLIGIGIVNATLMAGQGVTGAKAFVTHAFGVGQGGFKRCKLSNVYVRAGSGALPDFGDFETGLILDFWIESEAEAMVQGCTDVGWVLKNNSNASKCAGGSRSNRIGVTVEGGSYPYFAPGFVCEGNTEVGMDVFDAGGPRCFGVHFENPALDFRSRNGHYWILMGGEAVNIEIGIPDAGDPDFDTLAEVNSHDWAIEGLLCRGDLRVGSGSLSGTIVGGAAAAIVDENDDELVDSGTTTNVSVIAVRINGTVSTRIPSLAGGGASGTIDLEDGSVGSPSLAFQNDPDTGLKRNASVGFPGVDVVIGGRRSLSVQEDPSGAATTISGTGTNRVVLASELSGLNLHAKTGHFEMEGDDGAVMTVTGYELGTAIGKPVRFTTDAAESAACPLQAQSEPGVNAQEWYDGTGAKTAAVSDDGDLELFVDATGVILRSPDGTRWQQTVSNAGATVWTELGAIDTTQPTVTINQAGGQSDPTGSTPIDFTVVFSEAVTGFTNSDVVLGGTAGADTAVVTGGPTTYNVAVSGMTGPGTVIASINAAAAIDGAGNTSLASTSTDNTVTYSGGVAPVTDNFNRADNAASLGVATSGQAWSAITGTWGISGNKAYSPSSTLYSLAVLDTGFTDVTLEVDAQIEGTLFGSDPQIVVKAVDANNYVFITLNPGAGTQISKKHAGGTTELASETGTTWPAAATYAVTVEVDGADITVKKDGVTVLTHTLSGGDQATFLASTKYGFGTGVNAFLASSRFDNLVITSL